MTVDATTNAELMRQNCSGCHRIEEKGRFDAISYRRTSPDGWEETINLSEVFG